jgi:hypothetical protein
MKLRHALIIVIASIAFFTCNSNDDNDFRDILEIWDLESVVVAELYDFNDDNDFTGNLTNELACFNFDSYTLYTGGIAVESISKNLALYFDSNSGAVVGTCDVFATIEEGIVSWSITGNELTFSFDGSSVIGTVDGNLLTFEAIDFPIFTNASLNQVDMAIPATFTYRLRQ